MSIPDPKVRQSNFELLRIIAMFMVLILHADFVALGQPDKAEIMNFPFAATLRVILEMASIVAVNVFVLISGWFGIRPSIKGITKFIFQCLFFSLGIYAVVLIKGDVVFSFRGLADCFAMMGGGYWFITSYLCLYIFSPVVNAFIETASKITYRNVLIAFFAFQTIYGFCSGGAQFIEKGYSAISFIGLYMLAGYIKRYVNPEGYSKQLGFWIYLATTTLLSMIYVGAKYYGVDSIASRCIVYSNPLVIISSVSLLIWFAKVRITSRFVNTIASSCFAVYLLHTNSNLYPFYLQGVREVVANYSIINFVNVVLYLFSWFILAIATDRLRIVLYEVIFKKITWK